MRLLEIKDKYTTKYYTYNEQEINIKEYNENGLRFFRIL